MKRSVAMAMVAFGLFAACGQKAETPAQPAPTTVIAKQEAAAAPAHEACGEHAQAGGDEANCPFPEENSAKAAAAESCGGHAAMAAAPEAKDGKLHLGDAFALGEAKPLASVLGTAGDGQELSVRVSGQIEKVCQKKGCWMVVKDGGLEARVIMKDHAFSVPRDAEGKPAQVEGVLKVRVFTEAQAKHLAEDGGQDPGKVQGEKKEFLLTATAVEIGG